MISLFLFADNLFNNCINYRRTKQPVLRCDDFSRSIIKVTKKQKLIIIFCGIQARVRDELAEELAERMARADEAHRRRLHNEIAAVEVQTTIITNDE